MKSYLSNETRRRGGIRGGSLDDIGDAQNAIVASTPIAVSVEAESGTNGIGGICSTEAGEFALFDDIVDLGSRRRSL